MTSYVTYEQFLLDGGVTGGIDQTTVERLLKLSSMAADRYCLGRIGDKFDKLSPLQQEYIQLAVIYSTNSLIKQGEGVYSGSELGNDAIASYSALNTSITYRSKVGDSASVSHLSKEARDLLIQTGLCYRGLR